MRIKKTYPKALAAVLIFSSSLMLSGCYPSAPDYIDDYDLVYTQQDKSYDFSKVTTYMLPDSVEHITDNPAQADHTYDAVILSELKKQLDALGWEQLEDNGGEAADLVVLPAVTHQKQGVCQAYCWWCYWGWWPGWGYYPPAGWDPTWGWWYPSDVVCATYNTGTLMVHMVNPAAPKDKEIAAEWIGVLNGLLEGSTSSIATRIQTNIDQMFKQSPYLKQ